MNENVPQQRLDLSSELSLTLTLTSLTLWEIHCRDQSRDHEKGRTHRSSEQSGVLACSTDTIGAVLFPQTFLTPLPSTGSAPQLFLHLNVARQARCEQHGSAWKHKAGPIDLCRSLPNL